MSDGYKFLTVWRLRAPLARVWDALRETQNWPRWWSGVLDVQRLEDGDPEGVGQVDRYVWKSQLPYTLAFAMRTTFVERHRSIEGWAEGELTGTGRWDFSEHDGVTTVAYHWHVQTSKAWMNLLEPALRPLFVWNHDWVMGSGGEGLARLLEAELVSSFSGEDRQEREPLASGALPDPMRHLAYVNYALPPERLRRYLPPGLELSTRKDERGRELAFLSVVMLHNYRVRPAPLGRLPRPRVTFLQANYRAYVSRDGRPAVWFFRLEIGSFMAGFDRLLFGVPTYDARLSLDYDWNAEAGFYGRYRFESRSFGRRLLMDLAGLDEPARTAPGFTSGRELVDFFCQPMTGYYREPDTGWLSRMTVTHQHISPKIGRLLAARSDILASLGLVYPDELLQPHSVLLHPATVFKGYLPDRGVSVR